MTRTRTVSDSVGSLTKLNRLSSPALSLQALARGRVTLRKEGQGSATPRHAHRRGATHTGVAFANHPHDAHEAHLCPHSSSTASASLSVHTMHKLSTSPSALTVFPPISPFSTSAHPKSTRTRTVGDRWASSGCTPPTFSEERKISDWLLRSPPPPMPLSSGG